MESTESSLVGVKVIIVFHLISLLLWLVGQTGAVIAYDVVAEWGIQDPRNLLDPAIVEVNRGIGLADTLVMLPLHAVAAIGLVKGRFYGVVASWLVFGMTVYWPTVFWCSQYFYGRAGVTHNPTQAAAVILPGIMMLVAVWGTWYLAKNRKRFR
jgi:hypothetical protein